MKSYRTGITTVLTVLILCAWAFAQQTGAASGGGSLALHVVAVSTPQASLMDPGAREWSQMTAERVGLNRTPSLYETDAPAALEIPFVEVRTARVSGKLLVHLTWQDNTQDVATLEAVPNSPPETRFHKALVDSTDRFFDAAAVMVPATPNASGISPSLQMGNAQAPVRIYYWNAVRGAMLMEAQGRGTTRRTGQTFPAQGAYRSGRWSVIFELPDLPRGTSIAFAVWNGSQQDRDGRKYFSVWHILE